jgi:hypothetical protein
LAIVASIALLAALGGAASATAGMRWSAAAQIATPAGVTQGPPPGGLASVSFPSSGLCVAAGQQGALAYSANPAAGAGSWRWLDTLQPSCEPPESGVSICRGSTLELDAISCPTSSFCVAAGSEGLGRGKPVLLASSDPTDEASAWTEAELPGERQIHSVSCASPSECVATGGDSAVFSSGDPAGGVWKRADLYPYQPLEWGSNVVSCLPKVCLISAEDGYLLSASEPLEGLAAWSGDQLAAFETLYGIACASAKLCVGFSPYEILVSTHPQRPGSWKGGPWERSKRPPDLTSGSCAPSGFCAIGGSSGEHAGMIATNPAPARKPRAWHKRRLDDTPILSVSCPSAKLCVAVDAKGRLLTGS